MSEFQQAEQESPSKLRSAAPSTIKQINNPRNQLFGTKSKLRALCFRVEYDQKEGRQS